ncbi:MULTISPECIES: hypothetical protein [Streptomyces]
MNYVNSARSNSSRTQEAQRRHDGVAGARRRRRLRTYGIAVAVTLTATAVSASASAGYLAVAEPPSDGASPASPPQVHGGSVDFTLRGGTARVDTGSLRVTGHADDGTSLPVSGAAVQRLGKPGEVTVDGGTARWS